MTLTDSAIEKAGKLRAKDSVSTDTILGYPKDELLLIALIPVPTGISNVLFYFIPSFFNTVLYKEYKKLPSYNFLT